MARHSSRFRLRDLRAVYRLIGECRDLGCYPVAWHSHLLQNVCELLRGSTAITEVVPDGDDLKVLASMGAGWPDPEDEKLWLKFMNDDEPAHNSLYEHIAHLLPQPGSVITRTRQQLLGTPQWKSSEHVSVHHQAAGNDERLYSHNYVTHEAGPRLNCLEIHRNSNDPPFNARETRLLHWLHHELGPLLGRQLAWLDEPGPSTLPPRHRQTLQCLLEGDTERQAAQKMGLSRSTVHEYVMAVYRHFAVSSRAELLAHFLRHRIPPNPVIKDFADAFRLRRKPEE